MNEVRARAYGVDKSAVDQYPAFTSTDQTTLRKQLRMERRMEFPKEGASVYGFDAMEING